MLANYVFSVVCLALGAVVNAASKPSAGTPVYTGPATFPTQVFQSMYYMPKNKEQEPRPVVTRLEGGVFPDKLNNPWQLPTSPPKSEDLMPQAVPGSASIDKLVGDLYSLAGQLFRSDAGSKPLCNVCRTAVELLQKLAHIDPEILPDIMGGICDSFGIFGLLDIKQECKRTLGKAVYGGPITQMLSYANATGTAPDATQMCAQIPILHFCEWPSEKLSDDFLDDWFRGKRHASAQVKKVWETKRAKVEWDANSKDLLRVSHVSDLHIDGRYMVGAESRCTFGETVACCRSNSFNNTLFHGQFTHGQLDPSQISEPSNYWGSLPCDTPWSLMANSMQAMHNLGGKNGFDLALFTGDLVAHDDLYRYSHDWTEYSEQSLYDMMKYYLGDTPLLTTLGNHDTSPENQMAPKGLPDEASKAFSWNLDYVADLWSAHKWLDNKAKNEVRKHYGAYSISPRSGLRVISLNTDFWYVPNVYNYVNTENPDMSGVLRFLTDELLAAEEAGERVWIIGHVLTGWNGKEALDKPGNLFYQIVSRFAPHTIAHIFFGHTHEDQFQNFYYNDNGESGTANRNAKHAVAQAFIAPSVTPYTNLNPAIRVYKVDPTTYDVLDYDQYYTQMGDFDTLVDSNANHGPVWRHLYSAREAYGNFSGSVKSGKYDAGVALNGTKWPTNAPLNGSFWAALTDEMEHTPSLVTLFSEYQSRLSPTASRCTSAECHKANICFMRSGSPVQGRRCGSKHDTVS